jgi:hypothetical protein
MVVHQLCLPVLQDFGGPSCKPDETVFPAAVDRSLGTVPSLFMKLSLRLLQDSKYAGHGHLVTGGYISAEKMSLDYKMHVWLKEGSCIMLMWLKIGRSAQINH